MNNCTSSCKTKDHQSYAECLRQNTPMFVGVSPTKTGWDQDKVKKDETVEWFKKRFDGLVLNK